MLRGVALAAFAFAGGAIFGRFSFATDRRESPYATLGQLGRVLVLAETEYVEPVDHAQMVEGAIKGMVRELDPHSAYMPPEDFRVFRSDTEGRFGGIGIEVDLRDDAITVIAPIEGSPAHRAGIKPGDRIVSIDGQSLQGEPLEKLVRTLRGPAGTRVKLGVRRVGTEAAFVVDLVREQIRVTSIVPKRLDGDVLYVRIKQFQEHTHDEFLAALARLRSASPGAVRGIVLDLRNNPGGLVDEATEISDDFLDRGCIYTTRHRGQTVDEVRARAGGAVTAGKVIVLVNEYSASAAELLAGALQDNARATIVGATTFGKGSVQTVLDLPGGAGLKLTTMRYYTPSGRSIQAQGIQPDILIEAPESETAQAVPVTRERDLEGHLPAEAASTSMAPRPVLRLYPPPKADRRDAGPSTSYVGQPPHGSVADIPTNPVGGDDFPLSVAYQVVLGTLPHSASR